MKKKSYRAIFLKIVFSLILKPFYNNGLSFRKARFYMKILSLFNVFIFFFIILKSRRKFINDVPCLYLHKKKYNNKLIIYIHGGGFVSGSSYSHFNILKNFYIYDYDVISIDYGLSPEIKFPKSIFQIISVIKSYEKKNINIYIGADSAGTNLLLASINYLIKKNLTVPKKIFLISPNLDLSFSKINYLNKDYYQTNNKNSSNIYKNNILKNYINKNFDINSKYLSPLFSNFSDYPDILIQASNSEILFDETIFLYKKLIEYKVHAKLQIWEDLPHAWHVYAFLPESKEAIINIKNFLDE